MEFFFFDTVSKGAKELVSISYGNAAAGNGIREQEVDAGPLVVIMPCVALLRKEPILLIFVPLYCGSSDIAPDREVEAGRHTIAQFDFLDKLQRVGRPS